MTNVKRFARSGALIGSALITSQCLFTTDACGCSPPIEVWAVVHGVVSSAAGPVEGAEISVKSDTYEDSTSAFAEVLTAANGSYAVEIYDYLGERLVLSVLPDSASGLASADVAFTAVFSVTPDSVRVDVELQPSQ